MNQTPALSFALYADGGVIKQNPSTHGGTWAFRLLQNGAVVQEESGVMLPKTFGVESITNNQSEMYALLIGLERLHCRIPNWITAATDWHATIYSDSAVSLGRLFSGYKWTNIPQLMHLMYQAVWRELNPRFMSYVLLDGHPTKDQLAAGKGKRGHPVSEHNVWCDHACGRAAKSFMENISEVVHG